jgi:hypothetical protein
MNICCFAVYLKHDISTQEAKRLFEYLSTVARSWDYDCLTHLTQARFIVTVQRQRRDITSQRWSS